MSKKKDKSLEARSKKPQICLDPRQTSNRSTQRIFTHTDSEIITDILMMMINWNDFKPHWDIIIFWRRLNPVSTTWGKS